MRILIVDQSTEGQARMAERIRSLQASSSVSFDFELRLSHPGSMRAKLGDSDLVLIGSEVGEAATTLAAQTKSLYADLPVLIFVDPREYSSGAFQVAYSSGVRKVFSNSCEELDILQELISIRSQLQRSGKLREAQLIVLTGCKGGSGVTTLAAGLAELAHEQGHRTLLWDLDIETRDLTRALCATTGDVSLFGEWVQDCSKLDRTSFARALCPLADSAALLAPPGSMAVSLDLVSSPEGIPVIQRIVELARSHYDVIIVDSGTVVGPAAGSLMRLANKILVVVGDCPIGASGLEPFLKYTSNLLPESSRLGFIRTSSAFSRELLQEEVTRDLDYDEQCWDYPTLAYDQAVYGWAGRRRTMYSMGTAQTQNALFQIASKINILGGSQSNLPAVQTKAPSGRLARLIKQGFSRWFSSGEDVLDVPQAGRGDLFAQQRSEAPESSIVKLERSRIILEPQKAAAAEEEVKLSANG